MAWTRIVIFIALAAILGVPLALRPASDRAFDSSTPRLIVVTPHVQQIRYEFGLAFARWHARQYGVTATIDWRTPGGTSEIIKQLEAQYASALKAGRYTTSERHDGAIEFEMQPGTIGYDVMLGGGSYDHTRLKRGVAFHLPRAKQPGRDVRVPMSVPAGFSQEQLDGWFGSPARVGSQPLYDRDQYWIGTALSSFGIVYNRDVLKRLGLPEPTSFTELADPRYAGYVALADPRQSGSVNTTFESIMNAYGWEEGWRILRSMSANTRYFTNAAPKPPQDVSSGDAAVGLAIDFYGRGQAQAVGENRVGYVDPKGTVYIDADPVSVLRGAPHPELAKRFIAFCLSEEAQAIWQYPPVGANTRADGASEANWGPQRYALRRMPIRRSMYTPQRIEHFTDKVNPFEIASDTASRGWRAAIAPMMGCFAIDIADEQRAAWAAINRAKARSGFSPDAIREMERLFFAWPTTPMRGDTSPADRELEFTPENFRAIVESWGDADRMARLKLRYTAFFRANYRRIVEIERAGGTS
jgi:ABC-type Fe3+ transport system substrate-binding protein